MINTSSTSIIGVMLISALLRAPPVAIPMPYSTLRAARKFRRRLNVSPWRKWGKSI
jgi:hypothetical protein